jgi:hypothetical protein
MAKQTKKQFDDLLSKATIQMKNDIAKREVIHFRLNEQGLKNLQDLAVKRKTHVGALVREWVLERLACELSGSVTTEALPTQEDTDLEFAVTQLQNDLAHMRQHLNVLKLRIIGKNCAAHIKKQFKHVDHGELLYDNKGLPR